jgi:hypothetical protein
MLGSIIISADFLSAKEVHAGFQGKIRETSMRGKFMRETDIRGRSILLQDA